MSRRSRNRFPSRIVIGQATEAILGTIKLSTTALVDAGTDDTTAITPENLNLASIVLAMLDIVHTATAADDHALEIDADAAGFGDVKAIDIDYITGAIADGQDEAVILANIDESASTGGDVVALEVLATEGLATIYGLLAGAVVNPVIQLSGTFANMDSALVLAVDRLTEFTTAGSDVQMFIADNDTITIGDAAKFEEIEFLLAIVASGGGISPVFEFSTGVGTWTTFTPVDGTNGMRNSGVVAWLDSDIPTWAVGIGSEFLIRITRTRNSLSTPPTESLVQIAAVTEFSWDKDGDVAIRNLNLAGTITSDTLIPNLTEQTTVDAPETDFILYHDASAAADAKLKKIAPRNLTKYLYNFVSDFVCRVNSTAVYAFFGGAFPPYAGPKGRIVTAYFIQAFSDSTDNGEISELLIQGTDILTVATTSIGADGVEVLLPVDTTHTINTGDSVDFSIAGAGTEDGAGCSIGMLIEPID